MPETISTLESIRRAVVFIAVLLGVYAGFKWLDFIIWTNSYRLSSALVWSMIALVIFAVSLGVKRIQNTG